MNHARSAEKGFTLIELAVVIAIIAILAAVAIPRFGNTTAQAECSNIKGMIAQLDSAMSIWTAENAATPTAFTDFVSKTALPAAGPNVPTITTVAFGTNAITSPCAPAAGTLDCKGTFKSYNPVQYTFTNGVIALQTATPVNGAPVCIK